LHQIFVVDALVASIDYQFSLSNWKRAICDNTSYFQFFILNSQLVQTACLRDV